MTRTTILLSLSILLTAPALACGMYVPDDPGQMAAMRDLMSIGVGTPEVVRDRRNPFSIEDLYFDDLVVEGVDTPTEGAAAVASAFAPSLAPHAPVAHRVGTAHPAPIGNVVGVVRAPVQRSVAVLVPPPAVTAPPVVASERLRDQPATPVRPAAAVIQPRVGPVEPATPSRLERVRSLLEAWLQPSAESASPDDSADTGDTGWASE